MNGNLSDPIILKALDGKEIHFYRLEYAEDFASPIPRFCIYCGSTDLSEGDISGIDEDGIMCKNCGFPIHDCCNKPTLNDFKHFMNEQENKNQ